MSEAHSLTDAPQTTHFRLLNAFAKAAYDLNLPNEHELSAIKLHEDLFLSGFERILLVPFFPHNPPPPLPPSFFFLSLTSFVSLTYVRNFFSRSHARRQRHTTQPYTSRLHVTSPSQVRHGMSFRGPCRASMVHRQHQWLAAPRRRHHILNSQAGSSPCYRLRGARSH